ncbi:MAG: PHP domain-containing protein [Betaproteobacteria bacterium]|nr:PHP domain-containing protein [Betaproteobacteria bacterium]MDH5341749.1 PHP domain-containing protein [Betaproteobacteria bacterium]
MMLVDLHSHSTCSDGLLSPADLVERAVQRGVDMLALTDHDELAGLAAARDTAARWGLQLIDGVEVSVLWEDTTLHIVGLRIDAGHAPLVAGLADIRKGRAQRARRIADSLEAAGISGSLEGARRHARNPELVSRAHFARYLVEAGHARDTNAVFRNFLTPGKPGYVSHQWATLPDAVNWINGSGGVAVIAHPGRYPLNQQQCERLLSEFVELGGAAIEVVTGAHAPDEFVTWARYARRFGLRASAGSDFHGPGEGYRDLGNVPVLPAGCDPVWTDF